ncbi:MAG: ATP-binding protein [Myxococcales bacterium]|nr:ATP-binding protein [Polyangiaceae bacterium]MDW8249128.1 ATP-binding protein [Myxococcales bacterium]
MRSRLAWLTALRLAVLVALLTLTGFLHLRDQNLFGIFSGQLILGVLATAFAASAVQAALLRRDRYLRLVAYWQILGDQLTWTLLAYVSGGISSGLTSFYGLTCLLGAVVDGLTGVIVSAIAALLLLSLMCAGFVSGLLLPPPDQPHALYQLTWQGLSFPFSQALLALILASLLSGYLAERLRRTGGQLAEAQERAARAEQLALLGRFAAGLAHEVRNPLGAIAGSIDLLASSPMLQEEDRVLCTIIRKETDRLNDLVTDMLELARPRAPTKILTDLRAVAQEVIRLSALSGRGTDVRVLYEGEQEPVVIEADAPQLRQILWNLVRNAIQASSAGSVVLVRVLRCGDGAVIEVQDKGQGISEAARGQLFDAFFTTRTQGIGIGLAVVKRIVDDHGWTIVVDSKEGSGATFRVTISKVIDGHDAKHHEKS